MTPDEEKQLRADATAAGLDPDDVLAALTRLEAQQPAPGKSDPAKGDAAPTGAESGAKAHGGRGYFAYEYPVLTVNEIRASLFMEPIADGSLYYSEWAAKHSGAAAAPTDTATPADPAA